MQILYDLQESFKNVAPGKFDDTDFITMRKDAVAEFRVIDIEDTKTLQITERARRESGIYINLNKINGLKPGDRLTITGRVGDNAPNGPKWSVALLRVRKEDGHGHMTQHTAPKSLFVLSHVLEEKETEAVFTVHTISWGSTEPDVDIYIDDILISRQSDDAYEIDPREKVFSFAQDWDISQRIDTIYGETAANADVVYAGGPSVTVREIDGAPTIQVSNRVRDWDAIDICIENFKLIPGNRYKITAEIRLDEAAPKGTAFMFQGIPGFDWRGNINVHQRTVIHLEHILSRAEVEKWRVMRITTNPPGSSVSFNIRSIEITRL
ncbi:MAG: hypothetical protein FWC70_11350 [Defluviitaleaceae bacterium]|nr:hypothetical protein [Defluviitaleaceae bacterium]